MATSPTSTSSERNTAIQSALAMRLEMSRMLEQMSDGSLTLRQALARDSGNEAIGRLYVVKLLESIPGVGKVQARRVMSGVGITEKRRVGSLEPKERDALVQVLG